MFNERLKELRMSNGLTQVELACELNVTKQCISNWENNNIQPSIDMLIKVANYFCVSTDYILGIDNRKLLDVSSLTDTETAHIRQIISDIAAKYE